MHFKKSQEESTTVSDAWQSEGIGEKQHVGRAFEMTKKPTLMEDWSHSGGGSSKKVPSPCFRVGCASLESCNPSSSILHFVAEVCCLGIFADISFVFLPALHRVVAGGQQKIRFFCK